MAGYYRQFVSYFAELAEPLVHVLTKDTPFFWGEEHGFSFHALIKALASSSVLVYSEFDRASILFTDTSQVAVGAILA